MVTKDQRRTATALLDRFGTTYADEAGIRLKDQPAPLYQLLVLSTLLSARISADIAVDATRELVKAGYTTPQKMLEASWQDRVDALGRGQNRRYDESTASMLGDGAQQVLDACGGDLRRLRDDADDTAALEQSLQRFKGIGPTGAAIFCREVQGVWSDLAPYVDDRAAKGADAVGLPGDARSLAESVDDRDLPRLVAACVRVALDDALAEEVRG